MIYKDEITNLREDIIEKEGQKIIVKGSLGRSKFFEKEATIVKAYPFQFSIKFDDGIRKSYGYDEILTRTIDLKVFNGESYSSIVPPKVEEPKKIKQETNDVIET